ESIELGFKYVVKFDKLSGEGAYNTFDSVLAGCDEIINVIRSYEYDYSIAIIEVLRGRCESKYVLDITISKEKNEYTKPIYLSENHKVSGDATYRRACECFNFRHQRLITYKTN